MSLEYRHAGFGGHPSRREQKGPLSRKHSLPGAITNSPSENADCFDVIKLWEDARIEDRLTDEQRDALKDLDQEII